VYFENNQLTDECTDELARMLAEKPNLKKLNLSYNEFTDPGIAKMMNSLEKNTKLNLLNIAKMGITSEGAR
jgi:Ran GTPase-activating protein (RanGAP) involved in mRNA processing and transport